MTQVDLPSEPVWPGRVKLAILVLLLLAMVAVPMNWRRINRAADAELAALRSAGSPTSWRELEAWRPAAADDDAADLYRRAFEAYQSHLELEAVYPGPMASLDESTLDAAADYVAANERTLALLRETVRGSYARFDLQFSDGSPRDRALLDQIQRCDHLLYFAGLLHGHHGRIDDASDCAVALVAMARALDPQPLIMWRVTQMSVLNIALDLMQRLHADDAATDVHRAQWRAALEPWVACDGMRMAMLGERAMGLEMINQMTAGSWRSLPYRGRQQLAWLTLVGEAIAISGDPQREPAAALNAVQLPPHAVARNMVGPLERALIMDVQVRQRAAAMVEELVRAAEPVPAVADQAL